MTTYAHLWYIVQCFFEIRNVSDKSSRGNQTYVQYFFFRKSCHLWDKVEKYDRAREAKEYNIIWRMGIAWWTPKGTNTHSEYVIFVSFIRQQYWHERASMLFYTYFVLLLLNILV
jgi:hypothetical protein